MAAPITVSIPHRLGRAEARRRLDDGFGRVGGQVPLTVHDRQWEGDRMSFRISALGQTATGAVEVFDASVTIEVELPGMLGLIADRLRGQLQRAGQLLLTK